MAIAYDDLFASLGKLVKHYNAAATAAQALPADVFEIEAEFQAEDKLAAVSGMNPQALENWQGAYTTRRGNFADYARARLQDAGLIAELNAPAVALEDILARFIVRMGDDTESIEASVPSLGSVTADGDNNGNGTVLKTLLLDGVTSPGTRQGVSMRAQPAYADLTSQLVINETIELVCTSDSFSGGSATEGGEQFAVSGGLPDSQHGINETEGSGAAGTITAIHGNTGGYFQNADFETWTVTDTPDNWTIDAGTPTTHIGQADSPNNYHGDSALVFAGTGAQSSIQISQAPAAGRLQGGRRYVFSCRVKASASVAAGALTIQFEGTGYTAGSSEKISIAAGALPTSYTLESFNVLMPVEIPDDLKLVIKWTGTPTNAKFLWVDDIGFDAMPYLAGFGITVVRGSTPFAKGDKFTLPITTTEGVFQAFFRRELGIQLPSAGSPTRADTLAT